LPEIYPTSASCVERRLLQRALKQFASAASFHIRRLQQATLWPSAPHPSARVTTTVNDADDTDHGRVQFAVDGLRKAMQQYAPKPTTYNGEMLWRVRDPIHGNV